MVRTEQGVPEGATVVLNLSGRGDKDLDNVQEQLALRSQGAPTTH